MKQVKTSGWAVVQGGEILVKTVSDTRRAAIVNWLVTEAEIMVLNSWTDDRIEAIWHDVIVKLQTTILCTTVEITWNPS